MQVATPKKGYKLVKTLFEKELEIPEEWEHKELDTISRITGGGTPDTTKNEYWDGDIPWAVPTDITNLDGNYIENTQRKITKEGLDRSSSKLLPKNSILLTTRATIGYCAICTEPMATNQGFQNVICNSDVDNLFILYALRFNKNLLISLANGTTFTEISKRNVSSVKIAIPRLPEQQKIASILSNVDDTIQKTDQIIKQTQRLKKGMMQKLLTRGIGHTKFKKVKWYFGKEIEIPEEWEIFLLKDISENGLLNGIFKRKSEFGSGTPLINVFDLYTGIDIDVNNLQKVKVTEKELKKFHVKIGDIFFDRSSLVLAGIGHSNIILKKSEPVVFECHVMKLSPKEIIIPEFLLYFTKSTLFTNYIMSIAKVATMTTISQPDLENAKILIPPQSEQKQIASILSNVDTQIQKEKIHKSNLERLKKGLMQKLLTGQIRVKVR